MTTGRSLRPSSDADATAAALARLGVGLLLGLVPLALVGRELLGPGPPYPGDGASNLLPPLHVRWALTEGRLPIYTDLWYGGEYVPFNPLFKGFYPPAWPMYVPGIPLFGATKVLLALHYVATPAVGYWFARREFHPGVAAAFALLFTTPMALFGGHFEKVFGWPWFVLLATQLVPSRRFGAPRRAGLLAGLGLGALLLAGDNYHFLYAGVLLASVVVATKAWAFARRAALGSLVGAPKLLGSIVPVLLRGADRPHSGAGVTLREAVAGLVGFWVDASATELRVEGVIFHEGYAVVGLGAVLVAALAVGFAYIYEPDRRRRAWLLGVVAATAVGLLLATRWSFLYRLPVVSTFRAGARAMALIAVGVVLVCWYAATVDGAAPGLRPGLVRVGRPLVVGLLVLSVANGLATWAVVAGGGTAETEVDRRVADRLQAAGCSSVWVEAAYPTGGGAAGDDAMTRTPYAKLIGLELTRRGIPLRAINYGRIGQRYGTHADGGLTFDALIVGAPLPRDGEVTLTGGWTGNPRGSVDAARLERLERYETARGPLYVYTSGACGPEG